MNLPAEMLEIFLTLKEHSNENYLVGGCVRDMILKKTPKDYDIVTDIPYDKLITLFAENGWKTIETGKQFLVLTISKNGKQFEIANFRKDGQYIDGRHPETVEIGNMLTDAMRRDITINALYYDPFSGIFIDPTRNGIKDIKAHVIRMIGNPKDRIEEDMLRIMRVYRLAQQLDFSIESRTLKECRKMFETMLLKVSAERIKNEIEKMVGI
jgi:tRNA nucleotidyltransferase (CCA-adding enzyme)